ncbi:MAG TPA: hypothetical protein ACQGQH_04795 [Xylella sp.]
MLRSNVALFSVTLAMYSERCCHSCGPTLWAVLIAMHAEDVMEWVPVTVVDWIDVLANRDIEVVRDM